MAKSKKYPQINTFALPNEGGFNNRVRTPSNMEMSDYPDMETRRTMQRIAMDIFVDCTNAGWNLCDAMESVFVSGLHMGLKGGAELQEKQNTKALSRPAERSWL